MRKSELVHRVVAEWMERAENDFDNAVHTVARGEGCPTDTVAFHAQQCAEKYLKALLILNGIEFPRTNDLEILIAMAFPATDPMLNQEELRRLTFYATFMRYPGDYEPVTLAEARKAVRLAGRVRRAVRTVLPNSVLWRKNRRMEP